ncbi:MAG: hypothetical protein JWP63_1936, partial [Candidatus Solibacter sp.]|nr:hypothetical protein [Candidatus Solibacter sp.]
MDCFQEASLTGTEAQFARSMLARLAIHYQI